MSWGVYATMNGMKMKEKQLQMVAHNIANANTDGYKEVQLAFSAVLSAKAGRTEDGKPAVEVREKQMRNFDDGPLRITERSLDLALQGEGFFEVQNERGTFYTRNGAFTRNAQGELVTLKGDRVMGSSGAIVLGLEGEVEVTSSGAVRVGSEEKGAIKVVAFDNPQQLQGMGNALFEAKGLASRQVTSPQVLQGRLEASNTNVMMNLVRLIEVSRQNQTYHQVMEAQNRIDRRAATSIAQST